MSISGVPYDHILSSDQFARSQTEHIRRKTIKISNLSFAFSIVRSVLDCIYIVLHIVILTDNVLIKKPTNIFLIVIHMILTFAILCMNAGRLHRDKYFKNYPADVEINPIEYHNSLFFNKHPYDIIKMANPARLLLGLIIIAYRDYIFHVKGSIIFGSMLICYVVVIFAQVIVSKNKEIINYDITNTSDRSASEIFLRSFLRENIPMILTEQILKGLGVDPECPICLENLEEGEIIRTLKCDHKFHQSCVDDWLKKGKLICPTCRHDIKNDIVSVDL